MLAVIVASIGGVVALVGLVLRHQEVSRACVPVIALPVIVLVLILWTVATTRLRLDAEGLVFHVRGGSWTARWCDVRSAVVRTPWEGSQPGGYSAGVRLTLMDGTVHDIPDTLLVRRADLGRLIEMYRAASRLH